MEEIIETERLILRPWRLTDIGDMVEGLNNFETAKYLTVPFPYTDACAREYIGKHTECDGSYYAFAIELKSEGKVIGGTSLEFSFDPKIGHGGIWFNQKYTGVGYGTEAWRARARFAFSHGAEALENGYYDFNERSKHMQEKAGAKTVGESTRFCPALGKEVREILVRIDKDSFIDD